MRSSEPSGTPRRLARALRGGGGQSAAMTLVADVGPIFLSGAMGSGKSTVGRVLAARLGVPFVDLDARIARPDAPSVGIAFVAKR